MISQELKNSFLSIIRLGIGHAPESSTSPKEWRMIGNLAMEQGLSAILVDGIERMPESLRPPKEILLQMIGETLNGYESHFEHYKQAIGGLAGVYNSRGFKMMILKGYACSLDWPRPNHRPCGDIDIWLFGRQKEADKVLCETGIEIDHSHHHHTVFFWNDYMVENHYDFVNVHHRKSNAALEAILKELGRDDGYFVTVSGEKVYLPSPNLHGLFLMRHLSSHFSTTEASLRQVLDWGFFVEKHGKDVDWVWLESVMERFGMMPFYRIVNSICVEDLGFDKSTFPQSCCDQALKIRVLGDLLAPEFAEDLPKKAIRRVFFKYRRWRANEWKNKLCYNESAWSSFWSGVWSHLMKPSSI